MNTGVWTLEDDRAKNVQAPVVHIVNLWAHRKAYLSQRRHLSHKIIPLLHCHPPELLHGQPLDLWRHWPHSPGQWGGQSFLDVPDPLPAPSKRLREGDRGCQGHACPHPCRELPLDSLPVFLPLIRLCCEPASLPSMDATSLGKSHLQSHLLLSFRSSSKLKEVFFFPIYRMSAVFYV